MISLKRKMLAVREDLAEGLSEIASRKGITLFGLANDALGSVIMVENLGLATGEIVEAYQVLEAARNTGFILCPESLWYEAVELAHRDSGDWLAKRWFEAGARFAKLYVVREGEYPLASFKKDVRHLTGNTSDFSIDEGKGGGELLVRCINKKFSESYSSLFSHFLEGAFSTFGFSCIRRDVAKGALQLRLGRKPLSDPAQESEVPDRS